MINPNYSYLYLHGFASGNKAKKATYLKEKLAEFNIELLIPDLNQNDFYNLTISRQIKQVEEIIANLNKSIIIFGSSMGGLIATLMAEYEAKIEKLILLAPAFGVTRLKSINDQEYETWADKKDVSVYHYGYKEDRLLHYNFMLDFKKYNTCYFKRQVPALVFHGTKDDVVNIQGSRNYVANNRLAKLFELNDDHSLENSLPFIWEKVLPFI